MSKLHDVCARLLEHASTAQDCLIGEGLWDYGDDEGLLDEARAVLAEGEDGWQPIETAPKDETEILTWDGERLQILCWINGLGWMGDDDLSEGSPTHWQPLPAPPGERQ